MTAPLIDNALLEKFDHALDIYIDDDVETGIAKAAITALLTSYSSRMHDINFLLKNRRANSANVLMRVAFETYVYLKYIFEHNNRITTRAKAYYILRLPKTILFFETYR